MNTSHNTIKQLEEENRQLRLGKAHYLSMFEYSNVAIWEEDFSEVKSALEALPVHTEEELDEYLTADPNRVFDIIGRAQVQNVNPATISTFGASSQEEMLGSIGKVLLPHSLPFLHRELIAIWRGDRFFEGETMNQTLDGRLLHLLVTVNIIGEDTEAHNVLVSMMDITDRMYREQQQAKLLNEIREKQLYSEIMQEITLALTSRLKRDPLLDTILEQVQRLVEFTSGNIRLIQGKEVTIVRTRGYEEQGAAEFMAQLKMNLDDFPYAKEAVQTRRPIVVPNTKTNPHWVTFPPTSYIHSFMLLPIFSHTKVYGLLSIEHHSAGTYSRETAEKLLPFAHAAALAFSRSELYEQLNTELKSKQRIQEELTRSVQQKDTLLKEIHHRIKNNLSLVSSLINLQSYRTEDTGIKELLEHLRGKVLSISLVHEKLYRSNDFQNISLDEYVYDLLATLESTTAATVAISTEVDIDTQIIMDTTNLVPIGLILTELFTNTAKYVRPPAGEAIRFSVHAEKSKDSLTLHVHDNGPGLGQDHVAIEEIASEEGLGLTLVENLTQQIDGSIEVEPPPGFNIKLSIPI